MFRSRRRPDAGPQLTPWGFYAVTPAKPRRDPLRIIALGAVLTLVLAVGGCFVAVGGVARQLGTAFEVAQTPVTAATSMEVQTGKTFALSGFRAAEGWALDRETLGGPTITSLRVTNAGERTTSLRYSFTFKRGARWLAEVDCSCPSVAPGATVPMECFSTTARLPLGYDKVMVADSY
jgi:hypothetical protein